MIVRPQLFMAASAYFRCSVNQDFCSVLYFASKNSDARS